MTDIDSEILEIKSRLSQIQERIKPDKKLFWKDFLLVFLGGLISFLPTLLIFNSTSKNNEKSEMRKLHSEIIFNMEKFTSLIYNFNQERLLQQYHLSLSQQEKKDEERLRLIKFAENNYNRSYIYYDDLNNVGSKLTELCYDFRLYDVNMPEVYDKLYELMKYNYAKYDSIKVLAEKGALINDREMINEYGADFVQKFLAERTKIMQTIEVYVKKKIDK